MQLKLKKMNWLVRLFFGKADGICLAPFGIYFKCPNSMTIPQIVNHERIHELQQYELMVILFYPLYLLEWGIKSLLLLSFRSGYYSISFEVEAYRHDHMVHYSEHRKPYAWVKYLLVLNPHK